MINNSNPGEEKLSCGSPHESQLRLLQRSFSDRTLRRNPYLSFSYFFRDVLIFASLCAAIWHEDLWYRLLPLWLLLGLNTLGLFQIGHETAHGSLFRSPTLSWWIGQIAFLPALHPYGQWKYGHNRVHHDNTVKLRGDLAWHPRSPERYARMSAFDRMMHRIYWSAFGGGIYYLIKMWFQGLIVHTADFPGARRDTRLVVSAGAVITLAVLYISGTSESGFHWRSAAWMFLKFQLIPFLILNYMIGITVYINHIHPDIPWKPEAEWTPYCGQVRGTTNYFLPGFINFFIHNIFIHAPHHIQPAIPFYNLPRAMGELDRNYSKDLVRGGSLWRDYFRITRECKLFDADTGRWSGYP